MKKERTGAVTKYLILVFGAFAIFFTGYPHIWSIYQPYAMELTGWSQGQTSMCFYLSFVTFVLGNIVGGRIQDKRNPKIAIVSGGAIFTASILLSALALRPSPVMMYITYGLLQGFGQGMIYTTILSTAQKWFPGRTGFSSGVIVTANGLFGFFMAPVSRSLLSGVGIEKTFLIIGTFIGISWILASIFIRNPKNRGSWNRQCTGRRKAGVHRKTVYIRRNVPHKEILLPACNYDVWFDSISDFISIVTDGTDGQGNQCFSCSCGGYGRFGL